MNAFEPALGFAVLDLHPIEHLLDIRFQNRRWRRRRCGDAIRVVSALLVMGKGKLGSRT